MTLMRKLLLMFLVPALAMVLGVTWYAMSVRFVTTNNAYVKSEIIAISADVDGRVVEVAVDDNRFVQPGDLLFTLDSRPYEIRIQKARAQIESARLKIEALRAEYTQNLAQEAEASKRVAYQLSEYQRQKNLSSKGLGVKKELDQARHEWERSGQELLVIKEKTRQSLAALGGNPAIQAEQHPLYLEATSAESEARLMLDYTRVYSRGAGIVSKMQLEPGEWVEQGESVFYLVGTGKVWIEANLKETQLTRVQPGQQVNVVIDAYPDLDLTGQVSQISAATGSEFMVLPAQNATGNWIKVVQRVPVRIELDQDSELPRLRAGMTVEVSIDTVHEDRILSDLREWVAMISK